MPGRSSLPPKSWPPLPKPKPYHHNPIKMIKNTIASAFAAVVMVAPAFAESADTAKFNQLMDRQIAALTDLCSALEPVTDKASAEAALPQVQAAIDEMKAVEEESKALGQPSDEEKQAIAAKLAQAFQTEVIDKGFAKMKVLMADMEPKCYGCKALEEALSYLVSVGEAPQA